MKGPAMRHILISSLLVIATITSVSASERYPTVKHYVNQTGQIMAIGQATQVREIAVVRSAPRALQIVPIVEVPVDVPVRANPAPRLVAIEAPAKARIGLIGSINIDPADWPSGRKCCRPGEAYFNENPDS